MLVLPSSVEKSVMLVLVSLEESDGRVLVSRVVESERLGVTVTMVVKVAVVSDVPVTEGGASRCANCIGMENGVLVRGWLVEAVGGGGRGRDSKEGGRTDAARSVVNPPTTPPEDVASMRIRFPVNAVSGRCFINRVLREG